MGEGSYLGSKPGEQSRTPLYASERRSLAERGGVR